MTRSTELDAEVYRIVSATEWRAAERAGAHAGAALDLADGFIHLSRSSQVAATLAHHFPGRRDLMLLRVDPARLPAGALRYEPSRGGELFPHLYAPLPLRAVLAAVPIPLRGAVHRLPAPFAAR